MAGKFIFNFLANFEVELLEYPVFLQIFNPKQIDCSSIPVLNPIWCSVQRFVQKIDR